MSKIDKKSPKNKQIVYKTNCYCINANIIWDMRNEEERNWSQNITVTLKTICLRKMYCYAMCTMIANKKKNYVVYTTGC